MAAGDFIICKVVVRDSSKHSRSGTIKEIVNEMQGEKSCKVENGSSSKKLGGAVHTEKQKEKVAIVMKEFKDKELKTSHGKKVTNPKQAVAIALSEAERMKKENGGNVMSEDEAFEFIRTHTPNASSEDIGRVMKILSGSFS